MTRIAVLVVTISISAAVLIAIVAVPRLSHHAAAPGPVSVSASSPSADSPVASGGSYSTSPSAEAVTTRVLDASVGEVFTSKIGAKTTAECGPSDAADGEPLRDWQCALSVPPNSGPGFVDGGGPQGSIDIEITGPHTWEQIS
jgi:hypothetical protein